jgi:predicted MFS family arabinose efflux permease
VLPVVGCGMIVQMAATNTVIQTIVDDDKRGRVMSFYSMAFMGAVPLGSLLAGLLVHLIGARLTVMACGLCCIAGSLLFTAKLDDLRRLIHPIYVRKGIIPEVAAGLQSVSGVNPP